MGGVAAQTAVAGVATVGGGAGALAGGGKDRSRLNGSGAPGGVASGMRPHPYARS